MALVLSRNAGESIIIDGDIIVTVVAIKGGKVKIAIKSPKEKKILREELILSEREKTKKDSPEYKTIPAAS